MRGYINVTSCLLALSMLVGCWKNNPTEVSDFKVQIKEMNLDGAKAMAHLQSGNPGTKASMEFGQEEALYLVYDNNEIRLPEIKFTVEAPDSWSEWDKKKWLEAIHVNINDPLIKDFGEYIYVYSSLSYYIDGNGYLIAPPSQGIMLEPGQLPYCPHSHTIIRKKDGICLTVDDNIGVLLYWASSVVKDSEGQVYFTSFSGSSSKICRLSDVNGEIEVRSVDMPTSEYNFVAMPLLMLQECNGDIYVAQSYRCFDSETGESKPLTQLSKVSSDLTFDIMYLEGRLLEFERYGDDAFLFVSDEAEFKVYNPAGGELVASISVEGGIGRRGHLLPVVDGIYMYYYQGIVIRYDAQSGTCTSSELNETIRGYFSSDIWSGWNYYTIYSPSEERSVEVLKINILEETVESLKTLEVPEGAFFKDRGLMLEDESEGKLLLYAVLFANGEVVEEINMQIIDPEIAQAYAEAKAKEHYGIDFGSYKVETVIPLDN